MAKKKKDKNDSPEEKSTKITEEPKQQQGLKCPICEKSLAEGNHYYCPHCGREIDYLLWAGVIPNEEQKKDIEENAAKILYPFLVVAGVYIVVWLCLYGVILRKCMTVFIVR